MSSDSTLPSYSQGVNSTRAGRRVYGLLMFDQEGRVPMNMIDACSFYYAALPDFFVKQPWIGSLVRQINEVLQFCSTLLSSV